MFFSSPWRFSVAIASHHSCLTTSSSEPTGWFNRKEAFLKKLEGISGISKVETQTYTLEEAEKKNDRDFFLGEICSEKRIQFQPQGGFNPIYFYLGGGFKYFLFSPLFGEDSHFD